MNHDLAWLEYCKTHGMDSMNRNTRSIFMAGAKAEREYCLSVLMRLHERASDGHNYFHYAANVIRNEEEARGEQWCEKGLIKQKPPSGGLEV